MQRSPLAIVASSDIEALQWGREKDVFANGPLQYNHLKQYRNGLVSVCIRVSRLSLIVVEPQNFETYLAVYPLYRYPGFTAEHIEPMRPNEHVHEYHRDHRGAARHNTCTADSRE